MIQIVIQTVTHATYYTKLQNTLQVNYIDISNAHNFIQHSNAQFRLNLTHFQYQSLKTLFLERL